MFWHSHHWFYSDLTGYWGLRYPRYELVEGQMKYLKGDETVMYPKYTQVLRGE